VTVGLGWLGLRESGKHWVGYWGGLVGFRGASELEAVWGTLGVDWLGLGVLEASGKY